MKKFDISIVTITYGQENWILETIEGILNQKFNGTIEFILANDNSPDQTHELIESKFRNTGIPENFTVKYTKHNHNKGAIPNFVWALQQANGRYVAICEGDDYWTDPLKLQKQVDFLEENHDYNICFHRTDILENETIKKSKYTYTENNEQTFGITDLINKNFIHTASIVYRNTIEIPNWIAKCTVGDYPLLLILSLHSKIKYLPDTMAVYRTGSGMWSTISIENKKLNVIKSLSTICENFPNESVKKLLEDDLYYKSLNLMNSIYPDYIKISERHNNIIDIMKNKIAKIIYKK
jgi:glycosyltransferase involved in cell wall biosynthesis